MEITGGRLVGMHVGWGRTWLRVGVAEREVSEHGYFFSLRAEMEHTVVSLFLSPNTPLMRLAV